MMSALPVDLRHAFRSLRRAPAFTAIAVTVLALGIAANATVFSVVNALMIKPLPFVPEPERIAWISRVLSYDEFRRVNEAQRVFSSVAAFTGISVNVSGPNDEGDIVRGQVVTSAFFDVFGVHPAIGRGISHDDVRTAQLTAVVSDRLWRRRFDANQDPLGAELSINGLPFTIVGVMPPGFVDEVGLPHDVWIPVTVQPVVSPGPAREPSLIESPDSRWLNVAGRLQRGTSVEDAQRGVQSILYADLPPRFAGDTDREATLLPMHGGLDPRDRRDAGPIGIVLMALVAIVLVIACANVANLLLARGAERRREIAIRRALGAPRLRIVGQLLGESLIVSMAAGAAAVLLTMWIADLLRSITVTPAMQFSWDLGPDRRVLAFAFAASVASAALAGLVPALQASGCVTLPELHDSAMARAYRRSRMRSALVATQVALSLALLVGAALFVRTLQRVITIDPGIDPRGRILLPLNVGHYGEADGRAVFERVLERLAADPRIRSAALAQFPPLVQSGSGEWSVIVEGREPAAGSSAPLVGVNVVTGEYFDTMGIPLRHGRTFTSADRAGAPGVVLVNEFFARRYWADGEPIGRRIRLDGDWRTVIGVVRDGRYRTLSEASSGHVYLPLAQHYESMMTVVARADGDTSAAVGALRHAVRAADPTLPVTSVRSYPDAIDISYLPARAAAVSLGAVAILALVLASAGVYGVTAHSVSRRTHEIGVRVALGGQHADVIGLVVRDALRAVRIGALAGVAMAAAVAPLARGALYGLSPIDPPAFAGALLLLTLSALLAAYLPARRAVRVDPAAALRQE
jgi:putative ABC transport system permease protein